MTGTCPDAEVCFRGGVTGRANDGEVKGLSLRSLRALACGGVLLGGGFLFEVVESSMRDRKSVAERDDGSRPRVWEMGEGGWYGARERAWSYKLYVSNTLKHRNAASLPRLWTLNARCV